MCLAKRVKGLAVGLDSFTHADSLTTLQEKSFAWTSCIHVRGKHCRVSLGYPCLPKMHVVWETRMKAKLETTIDDLNDASNKIEDLYNAGVVEGFTKQPFSQKTLSCDITKTAIPVMFIKTLHISFLHLILFHVILSYIVWGSIPVRSEEDLGKTYIDARLKCWPYDFPLCWNQTPVV